MSSNSEDSTFNVVFINLDNNNNDEDSDDDSDGDDNMPPPEFIINIMNLIMKQEMKKAMLQKKRDNPVKWTRQNKPINLEHNSKCPIDLDSFDQNTKYCICATCSRNFKYDNLTKWFQDNVNDTCPNCVSKWTDYTVFTNVG